MTYFELLDCGDDYLEIEARGPFSTVRKRGKFRLKITAAEVWPELPAQKAQPKRQSEFILQLCEAPKTTKEVVAAVRRSKLSKARDVRSSVSGSLTALCKQGKLQRLGDLYFRPGVSPKLIAQASTSFRRLLQEVAAQGLDLNALTESAKTPHSNTQKRDTQKLT